MSQNGGAELRTGGPVSGMLAAPITARSRPPHHTSFWQRPHSEQKELKAHGRLPSSTSVYSDGLLEVPELLYMYMDTQTWKWNGPVPVPTPAGDVSVGGKGEISRITSAYLYSSQEGHADGVT